MGSMPDGKSDHTFVSSESPPAQKRHPALESSRPPLPRNSSTETIDLALDLDLDRRLHEDEERSDLESRGKEGDSTGSEKEAPPPPAGPATLAHDDPESEWLAARAEV